MLVSVAAEHESAPPLAPYQQLRSHARWFEVLGGESSAASAISDKFSGPSASAYRNPRYLTSSQAASLVADQRLGILLQHRMRCDRERSESGQPAQMLTAAIPCWTASPPG